MFEYDSKYTREPGTIFTLELIIDTKHGSVQELLNLWQKAWQVWALAELIL